MTMFRPNSQRKLRSSHGSEAGRHRANAITDGLKLVDLPLGSCRSFGQIASLVVCERSESSSTPIYHGKIMRGGRHVRVSEA